MASVSASDPHMEHYLTRMIFTSEVHTVEMATKNITRICLDRMYWIARVYRPEVAVALLEGRPAVSAEVRRSIDFMEVLEAVAAADTPSQRRKLSKAWRARSKGLTVYVPGMYPRAVRTVLWKNVLRKKSSTLPVVVPCLCQDLLNDDVELGTGQKQDVVTMDILVKREGVLKDVVMMDCLGIIHDTLRHSQQMQWLPNIVWYSVVPTSASSGLVAMVPRSRSLHGIQSGLKLTLLNYLLEHSKEGDDVHGLRLSFVRSCAVCSMQSMLFGLGDRHLENILLTEDGNMFHVDYSYLFGQEPHVKTLVNPGCMKLTPSIIDAMGGEHSRYYKIFHQQAQLVFRLLRRRAPEFYCVCEPLVKTGEVDAQALLKHFYAVFRPGETIEEAGIQIENIINYNTNHRLMDSLLDKMHSACAVFF